MLIKVINIDDKNYSPVLFVCRNWSR